MISPAQRRKIEAAARKAGWDYENGVPYQRDGGAFGWDIPTRYNRPERGAGWIGAWTSDDLYLLAARLLNVKVSRKKGGGR